MSIRILLYIALSAGVYSCKKDKKQPEPSPALPSAGYSFTCEDTTLDWSPLEFDADFGQVIQYYGKWSVWRTMYDPNDPNIIYYLTKEQIGPYHDLWRYDRNTNIKTHLAQNVLNNLDISCKGWVAFENISEIYKIKSNGDSLTQVSYNGGGWPTWSEDGKHIFFLGHSASQVYKHNHVSNKIVDTIDNMYSGVAVYKNDIFYYTYSQATEIGSIVKRNMNDNSITTIVSRGGSDDDTGENIGRWFIDNSGKNLYWSGEHGLSVTNLTTFQTKRVINSGRGSHTWFYYFNKSPKNGQIIATCAFYSVVNTLLMDVKNYTWEFSADGKCRRKIELPD